MISLMMFMLLELRSLFYRSIQLALAICAIYKHDLRTRMLLTEDRFLCIFIIIDNIKCKDDERKSSYKRVFYSEPGVGVSRLNQL